jgi:hypothetical protein
VTKKLTQWCVIGKKDKYKKKILLEGNTGKIIDFRLFRKLVMGVQET